MNRLARLSVLAALTGAAAAIPLLLFAGGAFNWLGNAENFVAPLFALICPPWELFWALMGRPDDKLLAARIGGMVLLLNALLYTPLGAIYVFTLRFKRAVRRVLMTAALVMLLGLGHLCFLPH